MPSHKHKKKKKNYKKSKKRSTPSSEAEDSLWDVKLSNSDSDEYRNEERLTSLVRNTYLTHLQQALTQNFEGWVKSSSESSKDSTPEMANKWCSILEQKAMRTCMISELYRKSMVSLIRQIKACTCNGELYIEERNLSKLKEKLPTSVGVQTDEKLVSEPRSVCEAETQTDALISSPLQVPNTNSVRDLKRPYDPAIDFCDSKRPYDPTFKRPYDPAIDFCDSMKPYDPAIEFCDSKRPYDPAIDFCDSKRPYDPAIDFCDSPSSGTGVSSSLRSKPLEFSNKAINNQDITSTSDILHPTQSFSSNLQPPDSINSFQLNDALALEIKNYCEENKPSEELVRPNTKKPVLKRSIDQKRQLSAVAPPSNEPTAKDNLDARLTAMGLLSNGEIELDTENTSSQLMAKYKKSNWFAEEIAQSCNFTRVLLGMSTKQRERVLMKIKELFGSEDEPLTELSEQNIAVCRKRIASVVVMELTPIYQGKRIASRHLFKFVAKRITKSLMEQSYAPESKCIRREVREFFSDGRFIMSESDCE